MCVINLKSGLSRTRVDFRSDTIDLMKSVALISNSNRLNVGVISLRSLVGSVSTIGEPFVNTGSPCRRTSHVSVAQVTAGLNTVDVVVYVCRAKITLRR